MGRSLAVALAAWCASMVAAVVGALLPSGEHQLSLILFASAVGLSLVVAIALVADGVYERRRRRKASAVTARAALERLEYVPAVTTPSRRVFWRGDQCVVIRTQRLDDGDGPRDRPDILGHAPGVSDANPNVALATGSYLSGTSCAGATCVAAGYALLFSGTSPSPRHIAEPTCGMIVTSRARC